jgi:CarD family transcriptional regulator
MFSRNEKVVYPGHGVAQINRILEKKIAGNTASFLELKFINKDMTILVPVNNAMAVGIRKLSSLDRVNAIFKMLAEPSKHNHGDVVATNWNKRNKEYQGKLRTGDLTEICEIYRDLKHVELHKELSFGEKTLLQQTELLLVEEIAIVKNIAEGDAITYLRSLISPMRPTQVQLG